MISGGDIIVRLIGDANSYQRMMRNAQSSTATFGVAMAASFGGTFIANALTASGSLEMLQVEMEGILGTAEQARTDIGRLMTFAAETPLSIPGALHGARTLAQYQAAGDDVVDTIRMLGDVVSGNPERFNRMALAFGQVQQAGKLMGQEVLQMVNAGLNPLFVISQASGRSMARLRSIMRDGGIPFEAVRRAFMHATSAGGIFHNRMAKMANTLPVLWSNLGDQLYLTQIGIGQFLTETFGLKDILRDLTATARDFTGWLTNLDAGTRQWIGSVVSGILVVTGLTVAFRTLGFVLAFLMTPARLLFIGMIAGAAVAINSLGGFQTAFEMVQFGIENFQAVWDLATTSVALQLVRLVSLLGGVGGAIVRTFQAVWANLQAGLDRFARAATGVFASVTTTMDALMQGASLEEAGQAGLDAANAAANAQLGVLQPQFENMGEALAGGFNEGFNNAFAHFGGPLLEQDLGRLAGRLATDFDAWRAGRGGVTPLTDRTAPETDWDALLGNLDKEKKLRGNINKEAEELKFLLRDSAEATFRIYDYTEALRGRLSPNLAVGGAAGAGGGKVGAGGPVTAPGNICSCPIWTEIRDSLRIIAGQPQLIVNAGGSALGGGAGGGAGGP